MMTSSFDGAFDGAFYESFDGFKLRKGKERKGKQIKKASITNL